MGRKTESRESIRSGSLADGGSEHALRSLPSSELLCTTPCTRCGGLLVNEWHYGSTNIGAHNVETLRCVQCGSRVDPVILQNQTRLSVERQRVWQERPKPSVKAVVLSDVA